VAEALGSPAVGAQLVRSLQSRMMKIAARARTAGAPPKVACVEWIEPLMAAGNWMPELVEFAGGINLFGEAGKHAPWMTFAELRERDPDVIVVLPCGYDLKKTREEMRAVDWSPLRGRIVLADGNQFFNRPGPRLAESLEILAEILHPDAFDFGHRGRDWEPY
jgi:iron complex transport system substrate-binding protein